jgi:hypothetical protein
MDRTKRTSCVASAITRSHSRRLLLVVPSVEHRLRPTTWHSERAVECHRSGLERPMRHHAYVFQRTRNYWRKRSQSSQLCIDYNRGLFQHLSWAVSDWPDVVLFTATKHFIHIYFTSLLFFPSASCCRISLKKQLRLYLYRPILLACKRKMRGSYIRYVIMTHSVQQNLSMYF